MGRLTKRNLYNIKCIFEEKTGAVLNPAHRTQRKRPVRAALALATAIVACLALVAFTGPLFSPLDGDVLRLSGSYEGNGVVTVYVENGSDKELKFQEQVKLYNWGTAEEIESTGQVKMENTVFSAHSSGIMTIDLSGAYDVDALESARPADTHTFYYYLLLTNQDFLFGQDWMCSISFAQTEGIAPTEEAVAQTLPPKPVEAIIAEDIEEELRFYFEDSYKNQIMATNEANFEYMQKVQELLTRFEGTVIPPVEPMLIVKRLPENVVLDESYPMERQYELVGQYHHIIDGYGRIVAGFNSPTGWENALTLGALLPQYQGEVGGGAEVIPLIYMFTYEVSAIQGDCYAFIYGQLLSFEEMEEYKVYEDDQYAVYEVTELFYTDLDAYLDYFLTTRSDIYCDEQIRQRVHNIYDYFKDKETLGSLFHYHLPGQCDEIPDE